MNNAYKLPIIEFFFILLKPLIKLTVLIFGMYIVEFIG